jgi:UbiD family decarboxylase
VKIDQQFIRALDGYDLQSEAIIEMILELAGALKQEPYELTQAVSQPELEVPAHAEVVLEGYVEPGVREPEGPFGDFMQFYVPVMANHVFRLTAITYRTDPILHAIHAGSSEDVNLLAPSREALILQAGRRTGATVCGVRLLPTILGCAIAVEQRARGEGRAVAEAALNTYSWLKYCIVVDHDVDVNSMDDVWWAVQTRSNPKDAVHVLTGEGFPRDPSGTHVSKAVIDATIPPGHWEEFERKHAPNERSVRLADFL